MQKTWKGAACGLALLMAAASADADLVQLSFTGNNDLVGTFIIDLGTPDSDPVDQDAGDYEDAFTVTALTVSSSAYTGGSDFDISIDNDFFGLDQFSFRATGGMWDGAPVAGFEMLLQDATASAINTDGLDQLMAGNLGPDDFGNMQFFLLVDDGFTLESMIDDFTITEVPEPTTGLATLIFFACLLGTRRRH